MATWIKEKKYDREIKWILFLISPFIGFIASLKDIKTRSSFSILFLFFFLFGLSFSVGNIRDEQNTNDAVSYRAEFEAYKNISFDEYIQHFRLFLTFKWPRGDYYFDTVAFIVSRISSNYHIMFAIFAIVFAFFSLKCSKLFIEEDSFDTSISSYILLYIFFYKSNNKYKWHAILDSSLGCCLLCI